LASDGGKGGESGVNWGITAEKGKGGRELSRPREKSNVRCGAGEGGGLRGGPPTESKKGGERLHNDTKTKGGKKGQGPIQGWSLSRKKSSGTRKQEITATCPRVRKVTPRNKKHAKKRRGSEKPFPALRSKQQKKRDAGTGDEQGFNT